MLFTNKFTAVPFNNEILFKYVINTVTLLIS